ncbi:hypothetical protein EMIHUDRAFT_225247 [Emiliania huxleyi CCMP1516]|uniref:Nudix hydrolase domain-containing protein n=2 Tax=Emiliania huxleyi TaxID=2903 RepID=A0A0D3KPI1_EMIH1|nr:hypothetical protein EMIHUDRAFT_225247 [Emiliania huxleyi CCMP1516]EOD37666.1 hypothetical protein EMIHUDRAFT_225247 [Emiliania huxleyi CCMP1516]|eukprot:XP_005790095.1 hypothetical protein EMIHUDRAFT_225247 [Emiliania huxleyi CCMP1516]
MVADLLLAKLRELQATVESTEPEASILPTCLSLLDQLGTVLGGGGPPPLTTREDRYGGVEIEVPISAADTPHALGVELSRRIEQWAAAGKRGLWLKIPLECAAFAGSAAAQGFQFHHAKPEYVEMTRWLPTDQPSPLPAYAFTQVGVGGVVVNSAGHVLMERVSPTAKMQGSWKLPGGRGLADPGEDFADTVREETGIAASLSNGGGVVSLRHSHGFRFGVGDLYVVVKLVCEGSEEIQMNERELAGARWVPWEEVRAMVAPASAESFDGKVSQTNLDFISSALSGALIAGTPTPSSRPGVSSMVYTARAAET